MEATELINKFGGWTESYWFYVDSEQPIELRYDPVEHVYLLVTEDGQLDKQNGVTTVCKIIDKSNPLMSWACKMMSQKLLRTAPWLVKDSVGNYLAMTQAEVEKWVMDAKNAHEEKLEDAGAVGHMAHNWVESLIKFLLDPEKPNPLANIPQNPQARQACVAATDWMIKHNVRWVATERKIYSRMWRYAGTLDGLCYVDSCDDPTCTGCRGKEFKDRLSVADWKTSNYLYMEYLFQTAAYEAAHEEEFDVDITDRWIIRLGKDDGEFEAWRREPEDFELDFGGFLDALRLTRRVRDVELNLQERKADIRAAQKVVREAAKAVKEAAEKAERARVKAEKQQARVEALAKECIKAKKYKGTRAPSCKTWNDGPCAKCIEIYELAKLDKTIKKTGKKAMKMALKDVERINKPRPEPKPIDVSTFSLLGKTVRPLEPEKFHITLLQCNGEHPESPQVTCLDLYCWRMERETRPWRLLTAGTPEPIVATIGESVSWHLGSDADGNAIPVYEEDEATVNQFFVNRYRESTAAAVPKPEPVTKPAPMFNFFSSIGRT